MKKTLTLIPILFLIFITIWLRIVNLGYSDYQGDEIKALWRPASGQSGIDFLYMQKKGPTEFLVTYLFKFFDPTFSNEFLQRLPFALAGILSIYFFYRLITKHYGKKIALYATLLFSINGIFIGLFRIIQYQPFVIFFSFLTLYFFTLALQEERWKITGIYAGVFFWTAALFSHYDAVFIAPFALYLLIRWYTKNSDLAVGTRLKHLLIPFGVSGLLLAAYFVPYLLSLPDNIVVYWSKRVTGEGGTDTRMRSSILNFDLYNPILGIYLYPLLVLLSLPKIKKTWPILLWFILPWVIMELAIYDPGTHIYTYLIPAIILAAFGLETIEEFVVKVVGSIWGKRLNVVGLTLLFVTLAGISHLIFIDHTPEYPYEARGILFWKIGGEKKDYKLWNFGFPYYRRWEDIQEYVSSHEGNGYYATNESTSISVYYVPYRYWVERAGYYIYINNPQTFRNPDGRNKIHYWMVNYKPEKVFEYNGRVIAEIYSMPSGSLEEIKEAGY
jgi:4-amino-4-deoxy-L-arabinose transferase-like glycosyltransferase